MNAGTNQSLLYRECILLEIGKPEKLRSLSRFTHFYPLFSVKAPYT